MPGSPPTGWEAADTGVFVGAIAGDYADLAREQQGGPTRHALTGLHRSLIANRVSYALGLARPQHDARHRPVLLAGGCASCV